nr:protein-methionine-sulfoxide reductase heme-binding subunit MsrQ [Rhodothalassium salexigens]
MSLPPLTNRRVDRWVKPPVHLLLALPLLWLGLQWTLALAGEPHGLGINPQQFSNRFTGLWALRWLVLALAVGPVARGLGWSKLMRLRRLVGLWAFAAVVVHLSSYVALDMLFEWRAIWDDIVKRTYITFGMAAFALLLPLALTSTRAAQRRLGRAWTRLHRLVLPAAALAVVHFAFLVKGNQTEPWIYAGILAALIGYRALEWRRRAPRAPRARRRLGTGGAAP